MFTTVLLIEKTLSNADLELITTLHGDEKVAFHVLMQPRGTQDELLRAVDDVAFGYLNRAVHEHDEPQGSVAVSTAAAELEHTLQQLRAAGAEATGRVVAEHPLQGLTSLVEQVSADEVIVLAAPQWIEGLFHRDWASQARHKVGVPVLQLFAQQD